MKSTRWRNILRSSSDSENHHNRRPVALQYGRYPYSMGSTIDCDSWNEKRPTSLLLIKNEIWLNFDNENSDDTTEFTRYAHINFNEKM